MLSALAMPVTDGLSVHHRLLAIPACADVPALAPYARYVSRAERREVVPVAVGPVSRPVDVFAGRGRRTNVRRP